MHICILIHTNMYIFLGSTNICEDMKNKYGVVPLHSFGSMPKQVQHQFHQHHCDIYFTSIRIKSKPLPTCTTGAAVFTVNDTLNTPLHSASANTANSTATPTTGIESLQLIAIMAATTTRNVIKPSTSNLSCFTTLLPSILISVDCGFRYIVVLGYDAGDTFYDSDEGRNTTTVWFQENISRVMALRGIDISLSLVMVKNPLKKPGPVFIGKLTYTYTYAYDNS